MEQPDDQQPSHPAVVHLPGVAARLGPPRHQDDARAEKHRENRHELLVGEHPAGHPGVEVRPFEVAVGGRVEVRRLGQGVPVRHRRSAHTARHPERVGAVRPSSGGSVLGGFRDRAGAPLPGRHGRLVLGRPQRRRAGLFIPYQGRRIGFEVKFNEAPKITRAMRSVVETLALDHLFVVCPGRDAYPAAECITVLPVADIGGLRGRIGAL